MAKRNSKRGGGGGGGAGGRQSTLDVRVRRIYDEPEGADGSRVLVDRVWPRGMAKDRARLDEWLKGAAPSTELRRWYGHDPERFEEFSERYRAELDGEEPRETLDRLRELAEDGPLTLLTATKDIGLSHAAILADVLAHEG
ncbi:DUF488 family protein [Streptomyces armeniacus]|uniref:DUF488 family protein n=1 Tax=Streptomyces armeniacus TaxID=83291 RepID=A0A345XKI9_9ACTN|nr:DUF488 family protein [Streptomyces armeniacus]AXK32155.1 DUF488 family protein [Streptomyces armeniacus]